MNQWSWAFLLLTALFLTGCTIEQQGDATLRLTVLDSENQPIYQSLVEIKDLSGKVVFSAQTNENGLIKTKIEPGNYTTKIEKEGFETIEQEQTIQENEIKIITINLKPTEPQTNKTNLEAYIPVTKNEKTNQQIAATGPTRITINCTITNPTTTNPVTKKNNDSQTITFSIANRNQKPIKANYRIQIFDPTISYGFYKENWPSGEIKLENNETKTINQTATWENQPIGIYNTGIFLFDEMGNYISATKCEQINSIIIKETEDITCQIISPNTQNPVEKNATDAMNIELEITNHTSQRIDPIYTLQISSDLTKYQFYYGIWNPSANTDIRPNETKRFTSEAKWSEEPNGNYTIEAELFDIRLNPMNIKCKQNSSLVINEPRQTKRTIAMVDSSISSELENELTQFEEDVESDLPVNVEFVTIDLSNQNTTPEKIRERLIQECGQMSELGCSNLEGVIFIGRDPNNFPYKKYLSAYDPSSPAPFMFYYQDLDGTFKKINENPEYYTGYESVGQYPGPEIYAAWIFPINDSSFGTPTEQLKKYFQKHHSYFSEQIYPTKSAVYTTHVPQANTANGILPTLQEHYGTENVQVLEPIVMDDLCPLKTTLISYMEQKPEILTLFSHGSPLSQWCMESIDFKQLKNQPLYIVAGGCSSGNFMGQSYSHISFPLAFINSSDLGLTFYGKLHWADYGGNLHGFNIIFSDYGTIINDWIKNKYVGKAVLLDQKRYNVYNDQEENFYQKSGPFQKIIIGSPFLYSKPAK